MSVFCCFPDLSLQDSLLQEYKKVCSGVRAVRIVPSGRSGRYAVIYLASMTDVAKALDETRSSGSRIQHVIGGGSSPPLEADIYLAADDLTDEK